MRPHEYIDRRTGQICREQLLGDRLVSAIYSQRLESASRIMRLASSRRLSSALAYLNYDNLLRSGPAPILRYMASHRVDFSEFVEPVQNLQTARSVFERQIRYWECRPLPADETGVVCPADARTLVASQNNDSIIFLKEKFFEFTELLDAQEHEWSHSFEGGEFAVFRLTPEKYHYVHMPASGIVKDFYEIQGGYHSCNPSAVISLIAPHAKNRRVVTIIETDVEGGTGVGLIAIVEVVALMVGQIVQCYSERKYDQPRPLQPGMFVARGQPKSLFRPGSSTVLVFLQRGRVSFCEDLLQNRFRSDAESRFSIGLGQPVVETDVQVRSPLACDSRSARFIQTRRGGIWVT
jgi:phosphatidylserine decarboxylase